MMIGPIGFAAPWLLAALIALPVLWLILRAVPPAPVRRRFPGVVLLLGLRDDDSVTDRTPWWLLLLRMLALAAVIIGLAGPVLNPQVDEQQTAKGPILILLDASWASARDWTAQQELLDGMLAEAGREGRTVALKRLSDPGPAPQFQAAEDIRRQLAGLVPNSWIARPDMMAPSVVIPGDGAFETRWFSDGLAHEGRDSLLTALERHGGVSVYESPRSILTLAPALMQDGGVQLAALRARPGAPREVELAAHGRDPAGIERVLASLTLEFAAGSTRAEAVLLLPAELRERLTHFELVGQGHAGAISLTDDSLKRREVALIAGRDDREGLELLSQLHYLKQALIPTADLLDGALMDILPANPDVIVLADVATLAGGEQAALLKWVATGGLLLRFAGPRLAASDVSRDEEAPLMPVRLRVGGRSVGGAMSWGSPKSLAPFEVNSPFHGLEIPGDVTVSSQVLAQPDPTLADRVIAQLSDGTPLVTRKRVGQGQVVLYHVSANAEWSTLPLSGLFVQMLERLAVSSAAATPEAAELAGTTWKPVKVLDGFGALQDAGNLPGIAGEALIDTPLGPDLRPGLYEGPDRRIARNVIGSDAILTPMIWPKHIPVSGFERPDETALGGWLLATALLLLTLDILASLALSGRLLPARATAALLVVMMLSALPDTGHAQDSTSATSEVVLAHVLTGNTQVDATARAGLFGLSQTLFFRTSVEPATPISVNIETDELAFFPLLYWPITPDQPMPSAEAYIKLNTYLRTGGMILFDTRDANISGFGTSSPNGAKLQKLAAPLDIPPLEPVPEDHVLTRAFYLLQAFPGRYAGRSVWAEAAPPDAEKIEGMPFRNLNDGVTPVVIGGNDWAAAWAMDENGRYMFPVGRGYAGERQRELAYRFGVNLVMHVLTGNYKSDQVHVPALLDRLGQ
jgi:hypothetical protein